MPNGIVVRQHTAAEVEAGKARLLAAGLTEEAASKVAEHPGWGPVVLAEGVIVALFPLRTAGEQAEAVAG